MLRPALELIASMLDRRMFVTAVAASGVPAAQSQRRPWRLGFLGGAEQGNPGPGLLREGLRSLGYVDGKDYVLEIRFSRADPERALALAAELVRLRVDVIVTQGSEATQASKQATRSIPIVFAGPSYPIEEGLVTSFAHPGGNITGITVAMSDTVSKHLQLLRDVAPTLADVALILDPANPGHTLALGDTQGAAASLRLKVHPVPMGNAEDRERAIAMIARLKPGALIVQPFATLRPDDVSRIIDLAVQLQIPSITINRQFAARGLLMAYGADFRDMQRRTAAYVDRILKGVKPADLPVERPTRFELIVNLKTARAIGLTVPQALLIRADELIQ